MIVNENYVRYLSFSGWIISILWKILADKMPKIIIYKINIQDLFDNLGNPHTPCPLVHPFPNLVPKPTKNPLIANP